ADAGDAGSDGADRARDQPRRAAPRKSLCRSLLCAGTPHSRGGAAGGAVRVGQSPGTCERGAAYGSVRVEGTAGRATDMAALHRMVAKPGRPSAGEQLVAMMV